MDSTAQKPSALDFTLREWEQWCLDGGLKPFVAKQIREWIFGRGVLDPILFSNLSKAVRDRLKETFEWSLPEVDTTLRSTDGSEKLLFRTRDGLFAECVLMPSENRITLCVSSQVGCRWGCTFCQTGKMGLSRSLSSGEILGQVLMANQRLRDSQKPEVGNRNADHATRDTEYEIRGGVADSESRKPKNESLSQVTNVVFMGMGEPLDNYDAVVEACRVMTDARLLGMSRHRVTVSTVGLVPEIERLGKDVAVGLAISLHSADDERRGSMMPVNRRYPLGVLKQALREYPVQTRHGITFEYVMIHGENDSIQHAKQLVKFIHGLKAKVNLIPMNPHPGNPMRASESEALKAFQKYLSDRSIPAPIRYSRGQDVSAACGQLAMKRAEELNLKPREVIRNRKSEIGSLKSID